MDVEYCNPVGAPESLSIEVFEEVLENGLHEWGATMKKVSFEMGSSGGDNYCSQIYRVRVTFQRESDPLESALVIVKSIPVTENLKVLTDLRVFVKEKIFYYNMLPRMEILMDNVKFGPKLYHHLKTPINTLLFEDLSASGYVMADREKGLDLSHCKMVMKKLGQFHGISKVLHKKDPTCMKYFQTGMLSREGIYGSEMFQHFFGNQLQGLIATISKWKGYEEITKKIRNYAANFKERLVQSQLPIPGELKVLNHGDLWVNNFLFNYKDNKVNDVVFVDLQMSIYGSPGYDLNYFLFTSVQLEVLKEKREELLRTYHTSLCETLRAHDWKGIPSFADILTEVRRREIYGFFGHYGVFPAIAMDKSQSGDNNLDNFSDPEFAKKQVEIMFSSKRLEETMKYTLKRFDQMGILD